MSKTLELTEEELTALSKTVGIAIGNLTDKAARHGGTAHGRDASAEKGVLSSIQQKALELMR